MGISFVHANKDDGDAAFDRVRQDEATVMQSPCIR